MTGRFRFFWPGIGIVLAIWFCSGMAAAQEISPGQEQQFMDAKSALEAAQKGEAGKCASDTLKQAQDSLGTAEKARQRKDPVFFTRASQLARAYAELAQAFSELKAEEEGLAAAREEPQKTKIEIDRLKKSQ